MDSQKEFKTLLLTLNKMSEKRVQKTKLRRLRIAHFSLKGSDMNSSYFFPDIHSLKTCKSLLIECTSETGSIIDRILNSCKHLRPNALKMNFLSIYKLLDKLGPLKYLDIFDSLLSLSLKVEGALLDSPSALFFQRWLYKALNLTKLQVVIEKGSPTPGALEQVIKSFQGFQKLEQFTFKTPSTGITDQEFNELSACFKTFFSGLKQYSIETNSNRGVTSEGLQTLSKALNNNIQVRDFSLNILGTSVGNDGLKAMIDALKNNSSMKSFVLKSSAVPQVHECILSFLQQHPEIERLVLDFTNSSEINEDNLRLIQEAISSLKNLKSYSLNVNGCHDLKGSGTYYLLESLGLFRNVKECNFKLTNFLEAHDDYNKCQDILEVSVPKLKNVEVLTLDFNGCSDWFAEVKGRQVFFLQYMNEFKNLRSLSLNLRKTLISQGEIKKLQAAMLQLTELTIFEIDISFCKYLSDKDLRGFMFSITQNLPLKSLTIHADDVRYNQALLSQDITSIIENSKSLQELELSLRKNLTRKEGLSLVASFEEKFPTFLLKITGGKAFTVVKPPSINNTLRKSPFARAKN